MNSGNKKDFYSDCVFGDEDENEPITEFPAPPEEIPEWAAEAAAEWQRRGEFELLALAEEKTGLALDLKYENLPSGVWGIHLVRGERGRIVVNSRLPLLWRRFAAWRITRRSFASVGISQPIEASMASAVSWEMRLIDSTARLISSLVADCCSAAAAMA